MANIHLQHFSPADVKLSKEQSARILKFFFPDLPIRSAEIGDEDASFAQALILEGIDASAEMGFVHVIFDKAYMKAPTDFSFIKDIATALCKQALKTWFRHATGRDLSDPKIYVAVRGRIALNFKSVWALRLQTGELTY